MKRSYATGGLALLALLMCCAKTPGKGPDRLEAINLAYAKIPQASIVQVALGKDFFRAEGLMVNAKAYDFGKLALAAVMAGEADLATVAETPVARAIIGGTKISVSAIIETSEQNTAFVANRDSGIQKAGDLSGKAIGVAKGTNGEFFLDSFLMANGIDKKTCTIVDILPENMQAELLAGKIAGAAIWNPTLLQLRNALGDKAMVFYSEDFYTEHFCLTGMSDFTEKNPEAMKKFLRAIIRAERFIVSDPEESLEIIAGYTGSAKESVREFVALMRLRVTLDQAFLLVLENVSRWMQSSGNPAVYGKYNFLDFVYSEAMESVAPERMRIIK